MADAWDFVIAGLAGNDAKPKNDHGNIQRYSFNETVSYGFAAALTSAKPFHRFGAWWKAQKLYVEALFYYHNEILLEVMRQRNWKYFSKAFFKDIDHLVFYARQFKSASAWRRGHKNSYNYASRSGLMYAVCKKAGIRIRHEPWTWEKVVESVTKFAFRTFKEWRSCNPGAYTYVLKIGKRLELIDLVRKYWGIVVRKYLTYTKNDRRKINRKNIAAGHQEGVICNKA